MARPPLESMAFPSFVELPVEWNHLDALRHVNNTHFIRWFESARVAYLQTCGLVDWMESEASGPILASVQCHYRRPVFFPDRVRVGARVKRLGGTSMVLYHGVYSLEQRAVVADGESHVVLFDYQRQRPVRIPDSFRQRVEEAEQKCRPIEQA